MWFTRHSVFLLFFFFSNIQEGISQGKSTIAASEDIFSDLPINDPSTRSILNPGESAEEKIRKNIFVSGSFNKAICYVGEPVLLSFELLSALKSSTTILLLPSFDGFTPIFMDPDNSFPKFRKQNNVEFSVFIVKQVQLLPDREGPVEIGPILLNNKVDYKKGEKSYNYSGTVSSMPLSINIKRLPLAGKPTNFTGTVGNFSIKASVKANTFPVGENNELIIEVEGAGNFYSLRVPSVYWPTGFHNFDISEKDELDQKLFPVKGKKIVSIPFVAEQQGEFSIPPVELNFFDPVSGTYRKSYTTALRLQVTAPLPGQKINSVDDTQTTGRPNRFYWICIFAAIILIPIVVFYAIKQFKKSASTKKRAAAEALKQHAEEEVEKMHKEKINAARSAVNVLDDLQPDDKYAFAFKSAILEYLQLKLNIPNALPEEMADTISALDYSPGNKLKQLLEECDRLLYTADSPDGDAQKRMLGLLHDIVKEVDNIIIN
ncbi:MAG: BatD family protein [Ferruginibacter sp.]